MYLQQYYLLISCTLTLRWLATVAGGSDGRAPDAALVLCEGLAILHPFAALVNGSATDLQKHALQE